VGRQFRRILMPDHGFQTAYVMFILNADTVRNGHTNTVCQQVNIQAGSVGRRAEINTKPVCMGSGTESGP
jgi:hypothetical protein